MWNARLTLSESPEKFSQNTGSGDTLEGLNHFGPRWTQELVLITASQEIMMSSLVWEPLLSYSDHVSVFDQKTYFANGMGFYGGISGISNQRKN